MKTRFKICIIIACFVVFYLVLLPIWEVCYDSGADCRVWEELILFTRPVIPGEWVGEELQWSGSTQGRESPALGNVLANNLPFITSMIVLPLVIIGFVVVWDKRK